MGHIRAATAGSVNIDNAHPFKFGAVTLVHNGTLYKQGASIPTYDQSLDVDSMQIALALSKYPVDKAAEVLSHIDGAFALVWYDERDKSVNMVRNSDRPLHFAFNTNKTIMWFMSDGGHLHAINKSFRGHDCKGTSVYEMDKHKILKFKKGVMRPEVIPYVPFVPKVRETYTPKSHSGSKTSATQRAKKAWSKPVGGTTSKPASGDTVKVRLQGRMRKIPEPMSKVLHSGLCLSPGELLQFTPIEAIQCESSKRYTVYGQVVLPEWGDAIWDATLYDVAKVQWEAYKRFDWLVRAVGITNPHARSTTASDKFGALLGQLVHCNWSDYEKNHLNKEAQDDPKVPEQDTDYSGVYVEGPSGEYLPAGKLDALLESGCIGCSSEIGQDEIRHSLIVNDGRDILCPDCVADATVGIISDTLN